MLSYRKLVFRRNPAQVLVEKIVLSHRRGQTKQNKAKNAEKANCRAALNDDFVGYFLFEEFNPFIGHPAAN